MEGWGLWVTGEVTPHLKPIGATHLQQNVTTWDYGSVWPDLIFQRKSGNLKLLCFTNKTFLLAGCVQMTIWSSELEDVPQPWKGSHVYRPAVLSFALFGPPDAPLSGARRQKIQTSERYATLEERHIVKKRHRTT